MPRGQGRVVRGGLRGRLFELLGDLLATQALVRGAAAVPAADVERTVTAVRERLAKEAGLRARWRAGELSYDVYGMRAEDES